MNIQSEFEDYYDWCAYMCSESNFWKRNLNFYGEIGEENNFKSDIDKVIKRHMSCYNPKFILSEKCKKKYIDVSLYDSFVIVGDIFVPFITIFTYSKGYSFIYKTEELDELFDIINQNKDFNIYWEFTAPSRRYDWLNNPKIDVYNNIRKITDIPIIVYSEYSDYIDKFGKTLNNFDEPHISKGMKSGVNLNGILKKVGFHHHYDAHFTIQEIEMYLNKLKNKEDDVQFSNKQKIDSHGFDKCSFRHRVQKS